MLARVAVVGDPPVGDPARWLARWYDADRLAAVVADPPPGDGPVLVVGERRFERELGREAALLADRLDVGVARRLLPHGPLAVRYLAEVAAQNWVLGPARAVELLDRVAVGTFSGAWLPRVGRLSDPAPTLGQHLRSWLPGGRGFLAVHVPDHQVHPAGQPPAFGGPDARGPLLMSGTLTDTVRTAVVTAVGAPDAYEVEQVVGPKSRYGHDGAVELLSLPADVPSLVAPQSAGGRCSTCDLALSGPTCPFCHAGSPPEADVPRGAPFDVRGDQ